MICGPGGLVGVNVLGGVKTLADDGTGAGEGGADGALIKALVVVSNGGGGVDSWGAYSWGVAFLACSS